MSSVSINGEDSYVLSAIEHTIGHALTIDQPEMRRSDSSEALKYMTLHQLARDGDHSVNIIKIFFKPN